MAQEPENAFRTTTSCLPPYNQLRKWHLIAQHVAMVTFLSHILKCTHTHGAGGKPGYLISWYLNTEPGNFPRLPKPSCSQGAGDGEQPTCLSGRRWVNSRSPTRPLRDLLESSFVVVDCFNVTALVFQKIGIVVVHLGIVGQGLHSWAVQRNRSRTSLADTLPHLPPGSPSYHSPSLLLKSLLVIQAPHHLPCICANTAHVITVSSSHMPGAPGRHKCVAAIQLILVTVTAGTSSTNTAMLPVARCCCVLKSELLNWKTKT